MFLWNRRMRFLKSRRNMFAQSPKKSKFMVFIQFFPPKCFSGHVECSFDNPAENFALKVRKKSKNINFFSKNRFLQNVPMDFSSGKPVETFNVISRKQGLKMRPIWHCNNKDTPVYHTLCFS